MPKRILTLLLVGIMPSIFAQTANINSRYVNEKVLKHVLLVKQHEPLNDDDVRFSLKTIPKEQINKFVEYENSHLKANNKHLESSFKKYYLYKYKLASQEEIDNADPKEFPYVLYRNPIKVVKNGKSADKGGFSYNYYFYDRVKDKRYPDINIYSSDQWQVLKVLLQELGDFLQTREYEMLYE